jgi:hypothetical protein
MSESDIDGTASHTAPLGATAIASGQKWRPSLGTMTSGSAHVEPPSCDATMVGPGPDSYTI